MGSTRGGIPRWRLARSAGQASRCTVKTCLVWLVLACLLPGVVGAAILFVHEYRDGRAQLEKDTIQTARALVQAVDGHLAKARMVAETLATDEALARGDFGLFRQRAREILDRTRVGDTVTLVDGNDQQVFNLLQAPGGPLPASPNPELVRRVFATGQPVISDIFTGPLVKQPVMCVFVPVILDGRVAYALSVGILAGQFNAVLKAQGLPPDRVAAVFDSTGTIAARTLAPEQFVGQKAIAEYIERIRQIPEGSMETTSREGIPILSMFSRSPVTNWTVAIGIPREILEADLNRTFLILALGVAGLFAIGLSMAWFVGERIARSVRAITEPETIQGTGDGDSRFKVWEAEVAAGLLRDRTRALREANESLLARERELMEAHRLARFGTWYWDVETDEARVSDSVREMYGRDVPPFAEQRGTLLTIESWERIRKAAEEALRTGIGYDLEVQVKHAGGSLLWINAKCEVVHGQEGQVLGLRGTVQDITERKRALEALLESEERFQAVFDQAAAGMAQVALDGRWLEVNDKLCSILGYGREELRGLSFQDITHPDDLEADLALTDRLLAGAISALTIEKRYIRRDGTTVWVELTRSLVRKLNGLPDYFVAVLIDCQRRKEAEAALEAARHAHLQNLEQQVAERTAALREAHDSLEARVAERTEQVRRLAVEATYAEERERQALARELHDDLGQLLHVVRFKLGFLGKKDLDPERQALVDEASSLVAEASRQVRSLTSQLSPPVLSTLGLPAALEWLSGEIQQTYGLQVACQANIPGCSLSYVQATILFRAARELLINVAKHSGSPAARVELKRNNSDLVLAVEDSGVGIQDLGDALAGTRGFGLASIRERISFLGGTMEIQAVPTGGVRILLLLPLEIEEEIVEEGER